MSNVGQPANVGQPWTSWVPVGEPERSRLPVMSMPPSSPCLSASRPSASVIPKRSYVDPEITMPPARSSAARWMCGSAIPVTAPVRGPRNGRPLAFSSASGYGRHAPVRRRRKRARRVREPAVASVPPRAIASQRPVAIERIDVPRRP
ncbi:MAG TPA: hypothetical protein VF529_06720 [Solirubrobacteraceae bacterium]